MCVSGVVYIRWHGTCSSTLYKGSLSNENVCGILSPSSKDALVKSILSLAILGGVPVFNLWIVKPYSFNLVDKNFDGFSPWGPSSFLLDPLNITALK